MDMEACGIAAAKRKLQQRQPNNHQPTTTVSLQSSSSTPYESPAPYSPHRFHCGPVENGAWMRRIHRKMIPRSRHALGYRHRSAGRTEVQWAGKAMRRRGTGEEAARAREYGNARCYFLFSMRWRTFTPHPWLAAAAAAVMMTFWGAIRVRLLSKRLFVISY